MRSNINTPSISNLSSLSETAGMAPKGLVHRECAEWECQPKEGEGFSLFFYEEAKR